MVKSGTQVARLERLFLGIERELPVAGSDGMPAVAFGCFLLLVHHELDHIVLVHEFLALSEASFGLLRIGVRPREFGLTGLLTALSADLALAIVEVAVIGLDSTLASQGVGAWRLVGELRPIFGNRLPHLVLGGGVLRICGLGSLLENEGAFGRAFPIFWLLRDTRTLGLSDILVHVYARGFEHLFHHKLGQLRYGR